VDHATCSLRSRVVSTPDTYLLFIFIFYFYYYQTLVNATKAIGYRPRAFFMTSAPSEPSFVEAMKKDAWYLLGPSQWQPSLGTTLQKS
jgi:hypothetical protein